MEFDITTGRLLLGALQNGAPPSALATLTKQLQGTGPDPETAATVRAMIGKRCSIKHTSYVGTVEGLNEARGGFYGGDRFPVLVRVDKVLGGQTNVLFEYSLDQVLLLETSA